MKEIRAFIDDKMYPEYTYNSVTDILNIPMWIIVDADYVIYNPIDNQIRVNIARNIHATINNYVIRL